jgi:nucleosome binding factor SPN SPT16 subunit
MYSSNDESVEVGCDELFKVGANFVCKVMDRFVDSLELIIDEAREVTHAEVCSDIEHTEDNEEDMIPRAFLQSGKNINFEHRATPTDDLVAMSGTYILTVATNAATVIRTMLVNVSSDQRDAYRLAVKVMQIVTSLLKPGAMCNDIYKEAKRQVQSFRPDLVPRLIKSLGYLTGQLTGQPARQGSVPRLDEKSEHTVEPFSIFVIESGFEAASVDAGPPWAVWVAQTVLIPTTGPAQVLTPMPRNPDKYFWNWTEDVQPELVE